jgi:adhesin HecA-like repeat protein
VALTVRDTLDNSGGGISGNVAVQLQVGSLVNQGGKVLAAGSGALCRPASGWTTATAAAWPVPVTAAAGGTAGQPQRCDRTRRRRHVADPR